MLYTIQHKESGRYVRSRGATTTASLDDAIKFSTGGDAGQYHGRILNPEWWAVVPVPAEMLDPITRQYRGLPIARPEAQPAAD